MHRLWKHAGHLSRCFCCAASAPSRAHAAARGLPSIFTTSTEGHQPTMKVLIQNEDHPRPWSITRAALAFRIVLRWTASPTVDGPLNNVVNTRLNGIFWIAFKFHAVPNVNWVYCLGTPRPSSIYLQVLPEALAADAQPGARWGNFVASLQSPKA